MTSILFSGKAKTLASICEPQTFNTYEEAYEYFGDCELVDAYKTAKAFGVEDVYLVNMQEKTDHIDFVELVENVPVDYFVPLDIHINDRFYDLVDGAYLHYAVDYMTRMSPMSKVTVLFTDEHASLYEDIDEYLGAVRKGRDAIYKQTATQNGGSRIAYVANNLLNYPFANVALGCLLETTGVLDAIKYAGLGNSVFDLSIEDMGDMEVAYFRTDVDGIAHGENLLNFAPNSSVVKSILVDRLLKYIDAYINVDQYIGRLNRPYIQNLIRNAIDKAFEALKKSRYVKDYEILNVEFVRQTNYTYSVIVNAAISIPFSTERIRVEFEGDN